MGNMPNMELTTSEVSNIWSAYIMNSLEYRIVGYFYSTTEDEEIKAVARKMAKNNKENLARLESIFQKEGLAVPIGFTDEDVSIGGEKVFSDPFILYFCHDLTFLAFNTYPSALSDCTRADTRQFFHDNIEAALAIQHELVKILLNKGLYVKSPQVMMDNVVDFVDSKTYLSGLFGGSRPLNAPEIANLERMVNRAQFSKMVFVTFHNLAGNKDVKTHFRKGRDGIQKVIDSLTGILQKENIPVPASGDYKIYSTELSPFSDKLMLYFVETCLGMFCFTMLSQALSSCLRSDIIATLTKISTEMRVYYGEGLLLSIQKKWLEQPPQAVDRRLKS